MADTKYIDRNGAEWIIVSTSDGSQFFGTPAPTGVRRYDPMPPDTDVTRAEGAAAALIEKYAAAHKADLTLAVTAKADSGAWLVLLLVAAVVLSEA